MSHRFDIHPLFSQIRTALVPLMLCLPGFAAAQEASVSNLPSVAVMPLQAKGVTIIDADVITDAIATQLQQSGTQRVLERAQMDQILKEQGFQQSGACIGGECALQMGKILSVDRILVGSVGLVGHTYTLNLRMVKVGSGEVLRSNMKSFRGSIDDVLTKLVPETVADLTGAPAPVRAATDTAKPKEVPSPVTTPASKSHWGWWVAGGTVVVAGGVVAAILLMKGSSTPSSNTGSPGVVPIL